MFTDLDFKFIPSGRGKHLLLIEDHTFNQVKKDFRYWNCSKRTTAGCKAKIKFDNHNNIISYFREHNHSAPKFFIHNGRYVKLR
ncbi:hypothetical protein HF086_005622 [Spodoptera exigua]|uniref:FLYWCH-type domain-containing protein n=1 Tax=Spodoptera exigua TaxID=7107 RepID=A0A922SNL2_SPOEX|nr:hypothetical protein HF086_005622 [Spodoptera exigua]